MAAEPIVLDAAIELQSQQDTPFQGARLTHPIEIDITGLDLVESRPGVMVTPNEVPLDVSQRVVRFGEAW